MSKRTRNFAVAGVAVFLLVVLASPKLRLFNGDRNVASPNPGGGMGLPVAAYVLQPEHLADRILTTGTVLASEEVELRSEIAGKVTGILFQEGSRVKQGDLLMKINDAELRAQLQRLEHQKQLAEAQEFRQRALLQKEAISQEAYDLTQNELNKVNADLAVLRAELDKTEIRAPFDGVIGLRYVSVGSYISSSTRVASLVNLNPVKIDFSVPERYAAVVKKGATVNFKISGSPREFSGSIYAIEPKIDPTTRTLQLRAWCANDQGEILPGAFAEVEFILQEVPDALLVPTEALVPDLQGQKVYVARGNKAEAHPVTTGVRTARKVQILSGLMAGDTVITSGILQMRPGAPVQITSFVE